MPADDAEPEPTGEDAILKLAIVGRPNAGKSTLINRMLGEDRLLVGPEAGITRDSIAIEWEFRGRPVRLIDTAGMRKRAKIDEKLEKMSVADTRRAIDFAEVVVLLLTDPLEREPPAAMLPFLAGGAATDGRHAAPHRVELDLGSVAVRARWRDAFVGPVEAALARLPARGVRAEVLSTEAPSESWLGAFGRPRAA